MLRINQANLLSILSSFNILTGYRIGVYDENGQKILHYPAENTAFCTKIREKPENVLKCERCDTMAFERCKKTQAPWTYKCHAGLMETAAPIIDKSSVVGYTMFNGMLENSEAETTVLKMKEMFREEEYSGITRLIELIPRRDMRECEAAVTVLEAITQYLLSNRAIVSTGEEFIKQINSYIDANIATKITAEELSFFMGMSRSRLFENVRLYLSSSLSDYISTRRIEYAKSLLLNSDKNISEITNECGFSDYVYFSRIFKKRTGMNAKEFREKDKR